MQLSSSNLCCTKRQVIRLKPKKKIPVFPLTCRNILESVGWEIFFIFCLIFIFVGKRSKIVTGAKLHQQLLSTVPENIQIMKFRTSRKLRNIILGIIVRICKLFVQFSKTC